VPRGSTSVGEFAGIEHAAGCAVERTLAAPESAVGQAYVATARRMAARLSLAAGAAPAGPRITVEDT
jgi:hypothetical protein